MKIIATVAVLAVSAALGVVGGMFAHASVQDSGGDASAPSRATAPTPTAAPTTGSPTTSPTTTTVSDGPLDIDDLLSSADLESAGFAVQEGRATRSDGDLQYPTTTCVQESVGGLTGGNVFSGDWYASGSDVVSESISDATNRVQAKAAAKKLVAWHLDCNGSRTQETSSREIRGGWVKTFVVRAAGQAPQTAVVIWTGRRVGVVGISPTDGTDTLAVAAKAADALA